MKRDSNDLQWQGVRKLVRERDNNKDRCLTHLSYKESIIILNKAKKSGLLSLDTCHIINVGYNVNLLYNIDNLILLNRYCHTMLDDYKDPLTEKPLNKEEIGLWWKKLTGNSQWEQLKSNGFVNIETYFNLNNKN